MSQIVWQRSAGKEAYFPVTRARIMLRGFGYRLRKKKTPLAAAHWDVIDRRTNQPVGRAWRFGVGYGFHYEGEPLSESVEDAMEPIFDSIAYNSVEAAGKKPREAYRGTHDTSS